MIQYNIDISNKEDVELAMQDLYSISISRGYEQKFLFKIEYDSLLEEKIDLESLHKNLEKEKSKLEEELLSKSIELESLQEKLLLLESDNNLLRQESGKR